MTDHHRYFVRERVETDHLGPRDAFVIVDSTDGLCVGSALNIETARRAAAARNKATPPRLEDILAAYDMELRGPPDGVTKIVER